MAKLFEKKAESETRTFRYPVMLNAKELEAIKQAALVRNMSVAEFMRRAALGRKADVRYETQIILELRNVAQEIRNLHASYFAHEFQPPEDVLLPVIKEATAAMLRISK